MKRTAMRRIKPLRQRRLAGPDTEREPKPWAAALASSTLKAPRAGSYGGSTTAAPKETTYRNPALLEMARNRPCLLLVPGVCNHRLDTTVAAHENAGKGMGIKAPDNRSVWACYACHTWYDQGDAPRAYKRQIFEDAMQMQLQAWGQVAADPFEPERFRKAARQAVRMAKEPQP